MSELETYDEDGSLAYWEELVDRKGYYEQLGEIWRPPRHSIEIMTWGEAKKKAIGDNYLVEVVLRSSEVSQAVEDRMKREEGDKTRCVVFTDIAVWQGYTDKLDFVKTLKSHGWRVRKTSTNLLYDFQELAESTNVEEYLKRFITQWGPLWRCVEHNLTASNYRPCIWSPSEGPRRTMESKCIWAPVEPVSDYVRAAKAIDAAVRIVQHLQGEKETPSELWKYFASMIVLFPCEEFAEWVSRRVSKVGVQEEKAIFTYMLHYMLSIHDAGRLYLEWTDRGFALKFYTGWGFFRAALIELLGRKFGAYWIYRCDHCGRVILPGDRERMPKRGQRVFCEDCKGKSSTLSMREKRQRESSARQGPTA